MELEKIDHICIAVRDVGKAEELFAKAFDLKAVDHYIDENEKINVARFMIGEVAFEVMESTSPYGEVAKFIEKNGEGVFLISLKVPDVANSMEELNNKGFPLIDKKPRRWRESNFAFLNPKGFAGVLIELID
ncbi:VOC family protein [Pelotomaculum terephthalicicum JT]|uniref:VOC family protein n=1 Tax=Pelotomaculum TaxID=191373 RepID=UPI0009CB6A5A|nr:MULTISPECIES: VOC family protein [Pelotomaculum]MCG9968254.1 VOC family protein [Pelotomaculum terephthalicicum JT]OPX86375.1 MAG: Glyoxalase/Bleomycin resistance protein/Dioxygenase superfamily protein [Pelotomaculum sp. PtaB.Bin117]OPY61332.1 MAG: Glyoxalase/Bleomycin resistance protein/Dioxygenase superfamily protein [Pelotomaculum sp. PtaU1.Bin065]